MEVDNTAIIPKYNMLAFYFWLTARSAGSRGGLELQASELIERELPLPRVAERLEEVREVHRLRGQNTNYPQS